MLAQRIIISALFVAASVVLPAFAEEGAASPKFEKAAAVESAAQESLYSGLVRWDVEAVRKLTNDLSGLPDQVAVRALWLAASTPSRIDATQLFLDSLNSGSAEVRANSAAILSTRNNADVMRFILGRLAAESDPGVYTRIVESLANRPNREAVRNLMEIMQIPSVKSEIAKIAAERLRRLTRANLTDNPSQWIDWWWDNSHLYD